MLSKQQSEVVAEALLSESRAKQQSERERADARRRDRVSRQSFAWFGLAGFVAGAAVGYLFLGSTLTSAFIGLALGFILGDVRRRHGA